MAIDVLMPALSPTMTEGKIAKWHKKEGDAIKSGDVLAEIETDKATMEVEAVDEGVLAKIVVPEGTSDVPVNQVIGLIAGEGEDAKAVGSASAAPAKATAAPSPAEPKVQAAAGEKGYGVVPGQTPTAAATTSPAAPAAAQNGTRIFASPLAK